MTKTLPFVSLVLPEADRRVFLEEIRPQVSPENYQRIASIIEEVPDLLRLLDEEGMSISRLRRMVFGARTEKTQTVCPPPGPPLPDSPKPKPKGHGRNGVEAYTGARRIAVAHPTLKPGDACPDCQQGTLSQAKPAVAMQITAQPPISAQIHELGRLRCNLCGKTHTAPTPPEAGTQKYDSSVGVLVSVLRYGSGMPHYQTL